MGDRVGGVSQRGLDVIAPDGLALEDGGVDLDTACARARLQSVSTTQADSRGRVSPGVNSTNDRKTPGRMALVTKGVPRRQVTPPRPGIFKSRTPRHTT